MTDLLGSNICTACGGSLTQARTASATLFCPAAMFSLGSGLTRLFDVAHHEELIAGVGNDVQPRDLHRTRRPGLGDLGVAVVVDGPNAAVGLAAEHDVSDT